MSTQTFQLPPELWQSIFSYLSEYEILNFRTVSKLCLYAVPEKHHHPYVLDLTWPAFSDGKSFRDMRKTLAQVLHIPSTPLHGQWYTALRITPHIEHLGGRPHSLLERIKSYILDLFPIPERTVKGLTETLCTRMLPSMPNVTTLWIVDSSFQISQPSIKSIFTPPRCAYLHIAWSQYSATLTTLEIAIHPDTRWPSYCPGEDVEFPALRSLRVKWVNTSRWSSVAMVLASKARNLIELSISMTAYHVEVTYLPEDPRLLPSLRTFRWNIPGGWHSTPPPQIHRFLTAFVPQLRHISIQMWYFSSSENDKTFDISKLHSFSLDMNRIFGSIERRILEQLEMPGLCNTLRRLVLRCPIWGETEMQRLFRSLEHVKDSLEELSLFIPSYSTDWLLQIATSTPKLESLHLVIAREWNTVAFPYSIFAKEVIAASIELPVLQAWRLRDITIRPHFPDVREPGSNVELMRAIASLVSTIYSFYGMGHMEVEQAIQTSKKCPLLDSTMFGWTGENA